MICTVFANVKVRVYITVGNSAGLCNTLSTIVRKVKIVVTSYALMEYLGVSYTVLNIKLTLNALIVLKHELILTLQTLECGVNEQWLAII